MRSRNGYTEEQMTKAVTMYQERPELRVADIAEQCGISDQSTISHWVKAMGLPLRVPKSEGWKKDCTTSHKSKGKIVTCPECGKRYKLRDGQRFCHFCGADITPIQDKFDKKMQELIVFNDSVLCTAIDTAYSREELLNIARDAVNLVDEVTQLYNNLNNK